MHVTLRMRREVWNLRSRRCFGVLERAFYGSLGVDGARLAVFSVQGNHVHMLVEARDRAYEAAGRISWPGMQYRRDIGAAAVESEGKEPA